MNRWAFPLFSMNKKIIRLCYRKLIDAASSAAWDRLVFESCYTEYRMQSQLYNSGKKYTSFAQLMEHVKGAEQLHFLVSAAATGYLQQLKGIVPDIKDNLGRAFLPFSQYRFEIIEADSNDRSSFCIAINFFTDPLHWHDTVAQYLLLSPVQNSRGDDGVLTSLLQLQPFVSIYSLREE